MTPAFPQFSKCAGMALVLSFVADAIADMAAMIANDPH